VNGIYAFGFLLRGLAFLYRPITHCLMPYWTFWLMAYYLAELPPVLFQFIAFWRLYKLETAERKQKRFLAANPAATTAAYRTAARPIAGALKCTLQTFRESISLTPFPFPYTNRFYVQWSQPNERKMTTTTTRILSRLNHLRLWKVSGHMVDTRLIRLSPLIIHIKTRMAQ
jgi:hypothetical protein